MPSKGRRFGSKALILVLLLLFLSPQVAANQPGQTGSESHAGLVEYAGSTHSIRMVSRDSGRYVSVAALAQLLGYGVKWEDRYQELYLRTGGTPPADAVSPKGAPGGVIPSARISVDSIWTRADLLVVDSEIYISLDELAPLMGKAVTHAATGNRVSIAPMDPETWAVHLEQLLRTPTDNSPVRAWTSVSGQVVDERGEGVEGVFAYAVDLDRPNLMVRSGISDSDGAYRIYHLPPGRYRIGIGREGYRAVSLVQELPSPQSGWTLPAVRLEREDEPQWSEIRTDRVVFWVPKGMEPSPEEVADVMARLDLMERFLGARVSGTIYHKQLPLFQDERYLAGQSRGIYSVHEPWGIYSIGGIHGYGAYARAVALALNPQMNQTLLEGLDGFFRSGWFGSPLRLGTPLRYIAWRTAHQEEVTAIDEMLAQRDPSELAGSVVEFLLRRYTRQQFLELARTLPPRVNRQQADEILQRIYGKTGRELTHEWLAFLQVPSGRIVATDVPIGGVVHIEGFTSEELSGAILALQFFTDPTLQPRRMAYSTMWMVTGVEESWSTTLPNPGQYYIRAFLDMNRNVQLDPEEPFVVEPVEVVPAERPLILHLYLQRPDR